MVIPPDDSPTIVLTADRSLLSHFRGNYILGFLSCAPIDIVPDVIYNRLFAPAIDARPDGKATAPAMGLRRLKAGLLADDSYTPEAVSLTQTISTTSWVHRPKSSATTSWSRSARGPSRPRSRTTRIIDRRER